MTYDYCYDGGFNSDGAGHDGEVGDGNNED